MRKASRAMDGAGRAARDWLKRLSDLTLFPEPIHPYSRSGHNLSAVKTGLSPRFCFQAATSS
jgi:hypothetical protein